MGQGKEKRVRGIGRAGARKGFALITYTLLTLALLGVVGLAIDLGRMYVVKHELQAFTDAAALAAVRQLDGTDVGVAHARSVANGYPNRWNFSTQAVSSPVVTFANTAAGPYVSTPPSPPVGYRYVRVQAQSSLPMYFVPAVFTTSGSQSLSSAATAAQMHLTSFSSGLLPYSPIAHLDPGRSPVYNTGYSQADPFNFKIGQLYTLRWAPPGLVDQPGNWCAGDMADGISAFDIGQGPTDCSCSTSTCAGPGSCSCVKVGACRGFIDLGLGNGSASIRQEILNNAQNRTVVIGQPIDVAPGGRTTESTALKERVDQDTDSTSLLFTQYQANISLTTGNRVGNGRRLVYVPVHNPWNADVVVDFATFFLPVDSQVCSGTNVNGPCCAEYVGPGVMYGMKGTAATSGGVYAPKLVQ